MRRKIRIESGWIRNLATLTAIVLLPAAGYSQESSEPGEAKDPHKRSGRYAVKSRVATAKPELNLGRIYVTPPANSARKTTPGMELKELQRQNESIRHSLQLLEERARQRKRRAKRVVKRPCV